MSELNRCENTRAILPQRERIYMATIQHGHGDKLHEWESHIQAPDIFRAAEIFKVECEPKGWWIVAIEEVDFVD